MADMEKAKIPIQVISPKARLDGRNPAMGSIVNLDPDVAAWWIQYGLGKHPEKSIIMIEKEMGTSGIEKVGEEDAESPATAATKSGNRKYGRPKATA